MNKSRVRLICPECSAVVISAYPESAIWERCPACKRHIWDEYDAMMADVVTSDRHSEVNGSIHATN